MQAKPKNENHPMHKDGQPPTCGAKTRSGKPCANKAVMPNGRCRMHGGKTPATNQNAIKHGIYADALKPGEDVLWDALELGSIDEELRLCRIRLRRALLAQQAVETSPNDISNLAGFELHEVTKTSGTPRSDGKGPARPGLQVTSRRTDYNAIIDRLIARIESLEKTRLELKNKAIVDQDEAIHFTIRRVGKDSE